VDGADLHVHSTASDGTDRPAELVLLAARAGLRVIALTDHDTVAGVPEARAAGATAGVRVIAGCEFSVAAPWGEMHLLAYFLPEEDADLVAFMDTQRAQRFDRMGEIVRRLNAAGVPVGLEEIRAGAAGGALGRPHAARALVARGKVGDVAEAFHRYLGKGRPAFVPKELPALARVTALVARLGGVTSAAHLKERTTRPALARLKAAGVDAIEIHHPAHGPEIVDRLGRLVSELGFHRTGGSDWHGEAEALAGGRAPLGGITIPTAWVDEIEAVHASRRSSGRLQ
jgi:predicted metal-dependent phosphoesterase TrpH